MKRSARLLTGAQISGPKLKVAFVSLGAFLLSGLVFLSLMIEARLEEARRDREEMVAGRVFDELEREVSAFLDSEAARPAYGDLDNTDPRSWAPFVVGYFREGNLQDGQRSRQLVAADGPTSENKRRTQWAMEQVLDAPLAGPLKEQKEAEDALDELSEKSLKKSAEGAAQGSGSLSTPSGNLKPRPAPSPAPTLRTQQSTTKVMAKPPAPAEKASKKASGASIIGKLNRAPARRKPQRKSPQKKKRAPQDQFSDYAEKF